MKKEEAGTTLARKSGREIKEKPFSVLPSQVIKGYASVKTHQLEVDTRQVNQTISDLTGFEVIRIDRELFLQAIHIHPVHQFSF